MLECGRGKTTAKENGKNLYVKCLQDGSGYSDEDKNQIYKTWLYKSTKNTTAEHDTDDDYKQVEHGLNHQMKVIYQHFRCRSFCKINKYWL